MTFSTPTDGLETGKPWASKAVEPGNPKPEFSMWESIGNLAQANKSSNPNYLKRTKDLIREAEGNNALFRNQQRHISKSRTLPDPYIVVSGVKGLKIQ
jgi:hypothetical protein